MTYDVIIIGGGAAGLFCALTAGARGRRVLVIEHNREVGAKILISGGGRCNFTNIHTAPDRFISDNPDFCRSALARFAPGDFIALIEEHRIAYYEKALGQLFCEGAGSARKIVRMLLDECAAAGVDIHVGCSTSNVSLSDLFRVETNAGAFESKTLVLAAGGLSIPKLGASDIAHRIARQFGLATVAPRPGLVPLTFAEADRAWMAPLSGVSADVIARAGKAAFRGAALFTHRGLSGPAILQASSYWRDGESILIDWTPDHDETHLIAAKRARPKAHIKAILSERMSARLAEVLAHTLPAPALGDVKDDVLIEAARRLKTWSLTPAGAEGYAKAEVTVGGVDTRALDQKTMAARAAPGLFVIGEAVDVTGWLGGYNFQWAWASGAAAGRAV